MNAVMFAFGIGLVMFAFGAIVGVAAHSGAISRLLCLIGIHHWDQPNGHCLECGQCDEFFGKHNHYL
jgi:hypothetical protein